MGDKVYFIVTLNDMTEIWSTDGTTDGTMVAYNPADTVDTEIENLNIINGKLVFTANNNDGVALYKLTDTDAEMIAQVGDSPEDFFMHDGLLFFVADDALWYTEGTTASTMAVPADVFDGGIAAMDVDGGEFVSNGTKLHFVAEEGGLEVIVTIDAVDIDRDPAASISERKALAETVNLYPMPSNGVITIESAQTFSSYKVFDLSLKEVASSTLESNQINVSLEKGMYILQLEGAETTVAKTIMIK